MSAHADDVSDISGCGRLHGLGADRVSDVFARMPALRRLDLSSNNLTALTFALPRLSHMDLANNDLCSLDDLIGFPSLEALALAGNRKLPVRSLLDPHTCSSITHPCST